MRLLREDGAGGEEAGAHILIFARLPVDTGAELADRLPAPPESSDQRGG